MFNGLIFGNTKIIPWKLLIIPIFLKWGYGVFLICQFRGVILPQRKIYRRNVVANRDRITEINEKTYWMGQLRGVSWYRNRKLTMQILAGSLLVACLWCDRRYRRIILIYWPFESRSIALQKHRSRTLVSLWKIFFSKLRIFIY